MNHTAICDQCGRTILVCPCPYDAGPGHAIPCCEDCASAEVRRADQREVQDGARR